MSVTKKTIDEITRTLDTIVGTERFPGRDASGDFKVLASTVFEYKKTSLIDTDGTFAANSDDVAASQKATKTYISNNTVTADDYSCLFYPSYQNLTAKPNSSNPNYQVDVAWDELRIENRRTTSKSFTLNITASGALGLDTGSEAVSTWYYIWAICNDAGTTVSVILSASATSPTLPTGYTKKRLIGAVYNMADGHFRGFYQGQGLCVYESPQNVLTDGTASTETEIDTTQFIPENANTVSTTILQTTIAANDTYPSSTVYVYGYINGTYCQQAWATSRENKTGTTGYGRITCEITTFNCKLQYKSVESASCTKRTFIDIFGFKLDI